MTVPRPGFEPVALASEASVLLLDHLLPYNHFIFYYTVFLDLWALLDFLQ